MKLIWHIIRKDIVRDRWALLTWALLFVGQDLLGVFARNFTGMNDERVMSLQTASVWFVVLQVVMGYILVARLVHADALIGTSIFWRTRPISAGRLLGAKVLGALLLFALLPVLLLLPWWLYCQFGWREILWTAVEVFGWQLLMIAPAFLVASLTDDLGRVLLWTLLLVIGLMSWIILLQSSLASPLGRLFAREGVSIMFTRLWVCSLILVSGSLAIAAHQFLTRRFVRSVGLVVAGLGLIALTGQVWAWSWHRTFASLHKPVLAPADPAVLDRLAFAVEPAKGTFGGGFKEQDADKKEAYLDLRLRVSGLPEDLGITAGDYISHTWSWGNGLTFKRSNNYLWSNNSAGDAVLRRVYALPIPAADIETLHWKRLRQDKFDADRAARGLRSFRGWNTAAVEFKPGESRLNAYIGLPNSYLAKMKAEPPAYHLTAQWTLYRPEVVAGLPLKDGARASGQAQTFHLLQMNRDKPVVISTRSSVTHFGVWFSGVANSDYHYRSWYYNRFATVNRVTGDIRPVLGGQWGGPSLYLGGVIVTWHGLQVGPRIVIRNDRDQVADPQWLEHSLLVMMEDRDVAAFDRVVETAKFQLEPDPAGQGSGSAPP
jgi:hypothetical protein